MDLSEFIKDVMSRPLRPGDLFVFQMGEMMANQFRTRVLLPPVVDADTINAELACQVTDKDGNVVTEPLKTFDRLATETEYVFPQDATVHLALVNIDDAGNRSDASTRDFVVTDTVPPAQPGELTIEILGEE